MRHAELAAAQKVLDALKGGTNADLGFFTTDDGRRVFTVTVKRGDRFHYGTGENLIDAYIASVENEPLPQTKPTLVEAA